jgi:hypothetical protein
MAGRGRVYSVAAALFIVGELHRRARRGRRRALPLVSAAALRCLLAHWQEAELAGVRFSADGLIINGVRFFMGAEMTRESQAIRELRHQEMIRRQLAGHP